MSEVWRPVPGYEQSHEVSSLGRVRSRARIDARGHQRPARLMSLRYEPSGYVRVGLMWQSRRRFFFVHRLVATAFLGECPEGATEVNHIDGDKGNNVPSNLEWCSRRENRDHAIATGLRCDTGAANPNAKCEEAVALSILKDARSGKWPHKVIADRYGVSAGHVNNIKMGRRWPHLQEKIA